MLTLTLACALTLGAGPTPQQVLAHVQATYKKAGDLEAAFEMTYFDNLRGKKRRESGKLWAKQDGRVRWVYLEPERKDFVFDGEKAYFYEPENAQVTEFESFQDSPISNALRFLWGQGNISSMFEVGPCEGQCDFAGPGEVVLLLRPKREIPTVDHILLVVDTQSYRVRSSIVFDPLGNRSEYRFSHLTFNAKIPERKFHFEVPKNVNIIRHDMAAQPH